MNKAAVALFRAKGATQHFLKSNSPAILAAVGVSGTVVTAYLAARASFKAARALDMEDARRDRRDIPLMDNKERVVYVWKLYIPTVVSGGVTISAIVIGTTVGTRRTTALAAAYSITDKALHEYRDKVREELGERKEHLINGKVAQDEVTANPPSKREVMLAGPGTVLCYERFTGRYFNSDMETLRKAENKINAKLNREMYAYLSDFYDLVGLGDTSASQDLGWDSDRLLEISYSSVIAEDGRPCLSIEYNYTKAL